MLSLLKPEPSISTRLSTKRNSRSKSRDPSAPIVSNFQIHQKLGRGSYAKVYKAVHLETKELAAVKVFNKTRMSPQDIQAVINQVDIHKKLHHSNIARIYEFYQTEKKIYVFMEYCQNGELFNYINSKGPLPQKKATKVFKQILSAIKYLRSQRVFHRDIKCENILFDKNWNAKLVDFGFATKQTDDNFSRTFCGSPSYTAPELFTKSRYKAETVDIWCLGITLYAMLQGSLPFDGKEFKSTKKNIIELKYNFRTPISSQAKQVFQLIFVEDFQRATIQDLLQTNFVRNGPVITQNFIDINVEQITIDPEILAEIENHHPHKSSSDIIQSVTKFKLDQNYSLYYMMTLNLMSKGKKVQFDIASPNFQKRKKKIGNIRLRKLSDSYKRLMVDKNTVILTESAVISKKTQVRIRPSLASIDLANLKLQRRNNSVDSPTKKGFQGALRKV